MFVFVYNLLLARVLTCDYMLAVLPSMSVQEHAGNDKSCVWHAADFADGELKDELFCIRFPSVESEYDSKFTSLNRSLYWKCYYMLLLYLYFS